ncbi:MAG: hypothetical protein HYX27_22825 [Acidobacteria bacterium]|nr:hypothetical protein [Acidobacteriota bacterium]
MESPAGTATAALYDGKSTELLVVHADAATGRLGTFEFHETRADHGEVELFRGFDWERRAPPGTMVLIPEAGQLLAKLDQFWLLWRSGNALFGQAVHHPTPLSSLVVDGERIIDRPIVASNQELHVYAWRGGKLLRRRYAAKRNGEAQVIVEQAWEREAAPARSISVPVPSGDGGAAVVANVNDAEGVLSASALLFRAGKGKEAKGTAEGRYRLMARHRMALHAGVKGRPALAMIAESAADGAYVLLEAQFDFAKGDCVWRRTTIEFLAPGHLQSAAVFYYKSQNSPVPFVTGVDQQGDLIWLRKRIVEAIRSDAGSGYSFPILTTTNNRYEAVWVDGMPALRRF